MVAPTLRERAAEAYNRKQASYGRLVWARANRPCERHSSEKVKGYVEHSLHHNDRTFSALSRRLERLRTGALSFGLKGVVCWALGAVGCGHDNEFVPQDPARGPGEQVGHDKILNTVFSGGSSPDVQPRPIKGEADWERCDEACQSYCDSQPFDNPIDEAMCPHLWGVGLDTLPVEPEQACRRIYADLRGSFPTYAEIEANCLGKPIANVAEALIEGDSFVFQNQRRWADVLRYNNVAVNFERI